MHKLLNYVKAMMKYAEENNEIELSDSENEHFRNICRSRTRMRILSDSESESDMDITETSYNENNLTEKSSDGTIWQILEEGGESGRPPAYTIFNDVSGPTAYAKRNIMLGNVISAFQLIIDNNIMDYIKTCTETEACKVLKKEWTITNSQLRAFLAILYARGAYEAKGLKASYLWSKKWGPAFFSQTMSRDKFMEVLRFLRFDKRNERSERLKTDKFALVSRIWNRFIENSQNYFKPDANITVDEQLFPTKARCRFLQYMPNKPDKFGIKFWLASDVKSKYLINGFPYLGKDEMRTSNIPLGEYVVLKLADPYLGCGRNITTDNFFTSLPLAKKLLLKKTTLVGTIRGNKRQLPKIAKTKNDNMIRFSTKLYKSENYILTIYKSKPKKKVLLISSRHKSVKIENNEKLVPETVAFYNKTKCGVDVLDQMAPKYSVKAGSRRWPLQVFYNILDLAAINAWILYKEVTGVKISRKNFIFQLAEELANDNRDAPSTSSNLPSNISNIRNRKSCQIGLCKKNRSNNKCNKYVCGKCTLKIDVICKKCKK